MKLRHMNVYHKRKVLFKFGRYMMVCVEMRSKKILNLPFSIIHLNSGYTLYMLSHMCRAHILSMAYETKTYEYVPQKNRSCSSLVGI